MTAQQNRRRSFRFNFQLARARDEPILRLGIVPILSRNPFRIAAERISLRDPVQKIELALAREAAKGAIANFLTLFVKLAGLEVIAYQGDDLRAYVIALQRVNIQSIQKTDRRRHACFLVLSRAQATVNESCRRRLTNVVS